MTCYIDILWVVNFGMDVLITAVSAKLIKRRIPIGRILAGSALSALTAVILTLLPAGGINPYLGSIAPLLPALFISFRPSCFHEFLKQFFFLYMTSFLFGGFIFSIMVSNEFFALDGQEFYSIKPIIICALVFGAIMVSAEKLITSYVTRRRLYCDIKVHFMGKTVYGTGFIDTGNFLKDPVSGKPVIIADIHCILGLFPQNQASDILNRTSSEAALQLFSLLEPSAGFRIIPYCTVEDKQKSMPAFVSDLTEIITPEGKNIAIPDLTIGITWENINLSTGSGFILNPEIFQIKPKGASQDGY